MGKVICEICKKKCKGQAIKLSDDKFLHLKCFNCKDTPDTPLCPSCGEEELEDVEHFLCSCEAFSAVRKSTFGKQFISNRDLNRMDIGVLSCSKQLSSSDFYTKEGSHYCVEDYRKLFAARCAGCNECVEGESVTALGKTFHQQCLRCTSCGRNFGAGDKVIFQGSQHLCHSCVAQAGSPSQPVSPVGGEAPLGTRTVAGLHSSTPARPQDIGLISSPDSDYSTDIKDWSDGRSPISPVSATSGYKSEYDHELVSRPRSRSTGADVSVIVDADFDADQKGYLSPQMHFMHYRSASPGSMSHTSAKSKDSSGSFGSSRRGVSEVDYGKFYRTSYLEKKDGYRRGPSINAVINDKPKQHYHWPDGFSYRKARPDLIRPKKKARTGASKQLAESRRKSEPYKPFKNQDAIQLSKIPDAQRHEKTEMLPIERDDWPAPPDPAAAFPELLREHRRRRRSRSGDGTNTPSGRRSSDNKENLSELQQDSIDGVDVDGDEDDDKPPVDPRFEKDIEHLSKIPDSGAAKIFIEDLKKKKTLEPPPLDPWSSSRSPSAAFEPNYKTRYESPIFASPSRDLELLARLPSLDESYSEIKYRTMTPPAAHFLAPRPGYGLKSPAVEMRNGYMSQDSNDRYYSRRYSDPRRPESSSAVLERTSCHSSRSDLDEYDVNTGLRRNSRLRSTAVSEGRQTPNFTGRRSVPIMFKIEEPPKVIPYERLKMSNNSRPQGLEECRLEENLSKDEFEQIFNMTQTELYHLPEWRRNDMKKRVELY